MDFEDERARRGHRLRFAEIRPGPCGPDHHLRDAGGPGGAPRRRPGAGYGLRRRRPRGQAGPVCREHDTGPAPWKRMRNCGASTTRTPSCANWWTQPVRSRASSRHASTHAAGVVISQEPLTRYVPLQRAARASGDAAVMTQFVDGRHRPDRPAEDGLSRSGQPDHPGQGPGNHQRRSWY